MATGSAANVVLDILFIGVLGMGISGAAWGTVISGLINLALISPHFLRGKSQFRLVRSQGDLGAIIGENLKHGFGFNVYFIVVNAFMLLGNALVLKVAGHDGLTLRSLMYVCRYSRPRSRLFWDSLWLASRSSPTCVLSATATDCGAS